MVRRVGFGGDDEDRPDRAAKKARRKRRLRSALDERMARRKGDAPGSSEPDVKKAAGAGRVIAGLFLILWLCGWSAGIVFAFGALMDEGVSGGGLFLIVWLSFAIVAWVFAARMVLRLARGEPLRRRKPGRPAASPAPRRKTTGDFHSGGEDRF